jgi:hypothetical protein
MFYPTPAEHIPAPSVTDQGLQALQCNTAVVLLVLQHRQKTNPPTTGVCPPVQPSSFGCLTISSLKHCRQGSSNRHGSRLVSESCRLQHIIAQCCFHSAIAASGDARPPGTSLFLAPGLSLQSARSTARSAVDADSATDESPNDDSASVQYSGSSPEAIQLLAAAVPMY